jgi:hypothetical protein
MIMILNLAQHFHDRNLKPFLATKAVVQDCQLTNSPAALDNGVVDCEE